MDQFEYKLLTISAAHLNKGDFQAELQKKFQKWGNEGWDLVKMEPINGGFWSHWASTSKFFVVFKRLKQTKFDR